MQHKILLGGLAGVVAGLLVLPAAANANTSVSPTSLNFGSQVIGTRSASQSVTVTVSCSTAAPPACTDQGQFVANPHFILGASDFLFQTNGCGTGTILFSGPLAGDTASCQFNLSFAPTAINTRQGMFRVGSDVSTTATVEIVDVALTGIGLTPPTPAQLVTDLRGTVAGLGLSNGTAKKLDAKLADAAAAIAAGDTPGACLALEGFISEVHKAGKKIAAADATALEADATRIRTVLGC